MTYDEALAFLQAHNGLHDSIVNRLSLSSSTQMNKGCDLVFERKGWNDVEIVMSCQKGYRVRVKLEKVRKMLIHETYNDIVSLIGFEKAETGIRFSLTKGFGPVHTWFEADSIELEELPFQESAPSTVDDVASQVNHRHEWSHESDSGEQVSRRGTAQPIDRKTGKLLSETSDEPPAANL